MPRTGRQKEQGQQGGGEADEPELPAWGSAEFKRLHGLVRYRRHQAICELIAMCGWRKRVKLERSGDAWLIGGRLFANGRALNEKENVKDFGSDFSARRQLLTKFRHLIVDSLSDKGLLFANLEELAEFSRADHILGDGADDSTASDRRMREKVHHFFFRWKHPDLTLTLPSPLRSPLT